MRGPAIREALRGIRADILVEHYRTCLPTKPWGGAGLIIAAPNDDRSADGKVLVATPLWRELSWVIERLKRALAPGIDYVDKYDFYPELGKAALQCIQERPEATAKEVLNAVVDRAERWALVRPIS